MQIRSATNADAEAIRKLVFAVLDEYGLKACHEGVDADLEDIEANYIARGGLFEVLEDDYGEIFGSVGLYPKSDGVVELRKMYLAKSARRAGLGKMMLDRMYCRACELGFRRIELETSSRLLEAIALYTRFGFRPFQAPHLTTRCDQAWAMDLPPLPAGSSDDQQKGGHDIAAVRKRRST